MLDVLELCFECIRLCWKVLERYGVYDVIVDECACFDTFWNVLMHSDLLFVCERKCIMSEHVALHQWWLGSMSYIPRFDRS